MTDKTDPIDALLHVCRSDTEHLATDGGFSDDEADSLDRLIQQSPSIPESTVAEVRDLLSRLGAESRLVYYTEMWANEDGIYNVNIVSHSYPPELSAFVRRNQLVLKNARVSSMFDDAIDWSFIIPNETGEPYEGTRHGPDIQP